MKSGVLAVVLVLIAIALGGCATPQRQSQPEPEPLRFDYDLHKPYLGPGPNKVYGQGFLRTNVGGVVTCAGNQVLLLPATPYYSQVKDAYVLGKLRPFLPYGYSQKSQCDAEGNFVFSEVPDGIWLFLTEVRWTFRGKPQGGVVAAEAGIQGGGTFQVIVSDKAQVGY